MTIQVIVVPTAPVPPPTLTITGISLEVGEILMRKVGNSIPAAQGLSVDGVADWYELFGSLKGALRDAS